MILTLIVQSANAVICQRPLPLYIWSASTDQLSRSRLIRDPVVTWCHFCVSVRMILNLPLSNNRSTWKELGWFNSLRLEAALILLCINIKPHKHKQLLVSNTYFRIRWIKVLIIATGKPLAPNHGCASLDPCYARISYKTAFSVAYTYQNLKSPSDKCTWLAV